MSVSWLTSTDERWNDFLLWLSLAVSIYTIRVAVFGSNASCDSCVLTYVAEITQPRLRGILASTASISVISGVLVQFLLGTFFSWRTVSAISIVIPSLSLITLFFVPESPHWLVSKNRYEDAKKSLAWLRGWTTIKHIEPEFEDLCKQMKKSYRIEIANLPPENNSNNNTGNDASKLGPEGKKSLGILNWRLYTQRNFLWPYGLVIFVFFLGHFSGKTTLQTYAIKIFATLKSPIDKYYATVILGVAEVLGCIVSSCLINRLGKRKLTFFSLICNACCFVIVATFAYVTDIKYLERLGTDSKNFTLSNSTKTHELLEHYNWVPTTCLISAAFFVHVGIRILPWVLVGEVFSTETRSNASGMSGGMSYIFSFTANKIFLKMVNTMTLAGTFWFYSAISVFGTVVLYFILPETEGKTLHEITEHFAGNTKLGNKVHNERKMRKKGEINPGFRTDENFESRF